MLASGLVVGHLLCHAFWLVGFWALLGLDASGNAILGFLGVGTRRGALSMWAGPGKQPIPLHFTV